LSYKATLSVAPAAWFVAAFSLAFFFVVTLCRVPHISILRCGHSRESANRSPHIQTPFLQSSDNVLSPESASAQIVEQPHLTSSFSS
jgi:hypothetical protein